MADKSKIEWTEATWNPITGCSVLSPGCTNCYAMRLAGTRLKHHPSRKGLTKKVNGNHVWTGEVRFNEQWLDQPIRWKRPRMIFVCAHGDLFHEDVPDEWIDKVFAVMALAPQHTFQVLTKRSARMREYMSSQSGPIVWERADRQGVDACLSEHHPSSDYLLAGAEAAPWPLPNVWLGVSAEDQKRADERIPDLLQTPAAVRWVSAEPLLGELDLERGGWSFLRRIKSPTGKQYEKLDWVVAGGESGVKSRVRDMDPAWPRAIRDACKAAGTAFYMKQMAHKAPIPDDLMIREYPND